MRELPILFSGPMVKAILDGQKTMTRRVVKAPVALLDQVRIDPSDTSGRQLLKPCPFGVPGDRLWVRETWTSHSTCGSNPIVHYAADGEMRTIDVPAGTELTFKDGNRPSIFMPRWASRLTLEVTAVRVERLHKISPEDAEQEGCAGRTEMYGAQGCRDVFRGLWDSLNAKRGFGWAENPWVWVVSFRRIKP